MKIETCRKNCGTAIDNLGKRKIQVLDESVKPFIVVANNLNNYIKIVKVTALPSSPDASTLYCIPE